MRDFKDIWIGPAFIFGFPLLGLVLSLWLTGCDGNHIIGDPPDPCFVESECVEAVTAEFCDDCGLAYWDGHRDGYQVGRCSVDQCLPGCPRIIVDLPVVDCDEDSDDEDSDSGKGHSK